MYPRYEVCLRIADNVSKIANAYRSFSRSQSPLWDRNFGAKLLFRISKLAACST